MQLGRFSDGGPGACRGEDLEHGSNLFQALEGGFAEDRCGGWGWGERGLVELFGADAREEAVASSGDRGGLRFDRRGGDCGFDGR